MEGEEDRASSGSGKYVEGVYHVPLKGLHPAIRIALQHRGHHHFLRDAPCLLGRADPSSLDDGGFVEDPAARLVLVDRLPVVVLPDDGPATSDTSMRSETRITSFSSREREGAREMSIAFTASKRLARHSWEGFL